VKKTKREKAVMTFRNTITRKISLTVFSLLCLAPFSFISAQIVEIKPKVVVAPAGQTVRVKRKNKKVVGGRETFAEKSIAVDAKVNISLCVSEGNLKITGWERNEIRAFVANGSKINLKVQQKSRQTNNPVWVMVTGSDPTDEKELSSEECLSGEEIELDVPRGAIVNVKGRTTETKIESVRKVDVKNIGGDISLNNIEQGIKAATYEGDVMVENSGGAITLETANGNIVAFDVAPSEIGDIFKTKTTSGAITLERIEHRQLEIGSNSGSIKFVGAFNGGGQYDFRTQNGTILLLIPEKSSCKINALYGFGKFNSEIKLNILTENNISRSQRLIASIGGGDANVNLTTYSGAIQIKKQ